MARKERGLGRGLEALLSPTGEDNQTAELAIEQIVPRSDQPRRTFDQKSLQELAESIKEHGILQPVLVRPRGIGYELIAGERRWRAAQIAGLQTIPGIIREMDDMEVDEASLIENLQRDDLSVLEEAQAYKNMLEKHNYTQEALAQRIGKSRAHIANVIRILGLPEIVLQMVDKKSLSAGHARALLALDNPHEQIYEADRIVKHKLSVRQVEEQVKHKNNAKEYKKQRKPEVLDMEEKLQKHFGTRAEIIAQSKGGKIEIVFYDDEDLERIIELMGVK